MRQTYKFQRVPQLGKIELCPQACACEAYMQSINAAATHVPWSCDIFHAKGSARDHSANIRSPGDEILFQQATSQHRRCQS